MGGALRSRPASAYLEAETPSPGADNSKERVLMDDPPERLPLGTQMFLAAVHVGLSGLLTDEPTDPDRTPDPSPGHRHTGSPPHQAHRSAG